MSNPSPPPKSGGPTWLIILLVVLGLLVLTCAGLCGGCIYVGKRAAVQVGKTVGQAAAYLVLMPAFAATFTVLGSFGSTDPGASSSAQCRPSAALAGPATSCPASWVW